MKLRLLAAAFALLLTAQAPPRRDVAELAWMSGHWLANQNGVWTEEVWAGPRGGTLMGFSWTGRGPGIGGYEYLRIQEDEDGGLIYIAQPGGGGGTGFHLVEARGTSVTFENQTHDYPQRIRYVRTGNQMVATISRLDGSNAMSWSYRRQ